MEINRSVSRHGQTVRHSLPDASDASTRAFTLQSQPAANRSRPLRTPPDVVSVYRTNPTQWTQCVHGQPAANRSRTVRASGKIVSVYTALYSCRQGRHDHEYNYCKLWNNQSIIGETGASCYNFHSKSVFHKNMQVRDFVWT